MLIIPNAISVVPCINATAAVQSLEFYSQKKKKRKKKPLNCQLLQVKKNSNAQACASAVALWR